MRMTECLAKVGSYFLKISLGLFFLYEIYNISFFTEAHGDGRSLIHHGSILCRGSDCFFWWFCQEVHHGVGFVVLEQEILFVSSAV